MAEENKRGKVSQLDKLDTLGGGESLLGVADGKGYQIEVDTLKEYIGSGGGGNVDFKKVASDIVPLYNEYYSLGNAEKAWRSLHVSDAIILGRGIISARLGSDLPELFSIDVPVEIPSKVGYQSRVMTEFDVADEYAKITDLPKDYATNTSVNQKITNLKGGASTEYDTLKKLETKIKANADAIGNQKVDLEARPPIYVFDKKIGLSLFTRDEVQSGLEVKQANPNSDKPESSGLAVKVGAGLYINEETGAIEANVQEGTTYEFDKGLEEKDGKVSVKLGSLVGSGGLTYSPFYFDDNGGLMPLLGDGLAIDSDSGAIINTREAGSNITVVNNLTSSSATDALSANQGKVLKGLIDSVDTKASNAASTAESALSKANANEASIAALGVNNTTLANKINEVDGVAKKNKTDIATLNGTTKTLQGSVNTLNVQMGSALSDIDKLITFYEGTDTDTTIDKWKELETVLEGLTESDNLAKILSGKADKSYVDSNFVTNTMADSFVKFGSSLQIDEGVITINGKSIKPLTSHQTLYSLTLKDSAGNQIFAYDPKTELSGGYVYQLTKSMVGLGNVENVKLSTWKGSTNITTLGTITSGTWNGSKIGQSYLDLSGYAKSSDLDSYLKKTSLSFGTGLNNDNFSVAVNTDVIATKSWVEGKNYLTSVSKAQVTTALGFTPQQIISAGDGIAFSSNVVSVDSTIARASDLSGYATLGSSLSHYGILDAVPSYSVVGANYSGGNWLGYTYATEEHGGYVAGGVISAGTTNAGFQLNGSANTDKLYFRGRTSGEWRGWKEVIHSGNIGSQSVLTSKKLGSFFGNIIDGELSGRPKSADLNYTDKSLRYYLAASDMTTGRPDCDGFIFHCAWDNTAYNGQLFLPNNFGSKASLKYRVSDSNAKWNIWRTVLDDTNLGDVVSDGLSFTSNLLSVDTDWLKSTVGVYTMYKNEDKTTYKLNTFGLVNNAGPYITFGASDKYQTTLRTIGGEVLQVRKIFETTDSGWKTVAFTDSTVAAATKLSTARTIWGQSFDGSGNVSGSLHIPYNKSIYFASGSDGIYIKDNSIALHDSNNAYVSHYLHLSTNGQTVIGGVSIYGNEKLCVNGKQVIKSSNTDSADLLIVNKNHVSIGHAFGFEEKEYGMAYLKFKTSNKNEAVSTNRISFDIYGHDNLLNILGSGNVGIGTTDPESLLHVDGNTTVNGDILVKGQIGGSNNAWRIVESGGTLYVQAKDANDGNNGSIALCGHNATKASRITLYSDDIYLQGSARIDGNFYFKNGGYITAHDASNAAVHLLHLSNANVFAIGYNVAKKGYNTSISGNYLILNSGGTPTERMRITSDGNVGIGTTNPTRKLHVYDTTGYAAVFQSNQSSTSIAFSQKDGDTGYLAYSGGEKWKVTNKNWGKEYTLIHSGNIGSQTVGKANALVNSDGSVILQGGEFKKSLVYYAPAGGSAAVGFRYYTSFGTSLCGIGAYSTNDVLARMYMGWGESPWESANCFSVSENSITYKGNAILHTGNMSAYLGTGLVWLTSQKVLAIDYAESDPVFTASAAYSITNTNKSNWTTAYNNWSNGVSNLKVDKIICKSNNNIAVAMGSIEIGSGVGNGYSFYADSSSYVYLGAENHSWYGVYAYSFNNVSDATKKDVLGNVELKVNDIANAPAKVFTWKDLPDKRRKVGTIAQYWQNVLPEVVSGSEGSLSMNYAELAVVSSIVIARSVETHAQRIERLEQEIATMQEELKILKGVGGE